METTKLKTKGKFHVSRRVNISLGQKILIQVIAGVVALIICGVVTQIVGGNIGTFYIELFKGAFGTPRKLLMLLLSTALLLLVSLAVTPAFKMKFWNIGAEGQIVMGALFTIFANRLFGGKVPEIALIFIMLIFGVIGGAIWAVIPAIFKALFNTNETLFTLMMNYIAMGLVGYFITIWVTDGSGTYGTINHGQMFLNAQIPVNTVDAQELFAGLLIALVAIMMTVTMFVYLKYQKHGYELTVVGESINTAKYIGINVKKVIIRTMILSGVICGLTGFLIVSGVSHTIKTDIAGGRGFTAILISWLANFNPAVMGIMSFLVAFINNGAENVAKKFRFSPAAFANIMTGIFFFSLIASTFFVNYQIKIKKDLVEGVSKNDNNTQETKPVEENKIETEEQTTVKEEK